MRHLKNTAWKTPPGTLKVPPLPPLRSVPAATLPPQYVLAGIGQFLKGGGTLTRGNDTRVTPGMTVPVRTATVLSRNCRADFGHRLTKKVMSHSRDSPGVTAPLRTDIVPLRVPGVWNPPLPLPPLKKSQGTSSLPGPSHGNATTHLGRCEGPGSCGAPGSWYSHVS